jgi:hypothetical protein
VDFCLGTVPYFGGFFKPSKKPAKKCHYIVLSVRGKRENIKCLSANAAYTCVLFEQAGSKMNKQRTCTIPLMTQQHLK